MGATVSRPSITADETAETITLIAGATIPTSFLRVLGCETMTVTAEAEVTRKMKDPGRGPGHRHVGVHEAGGRRRRHGQNHQV